MGQRTTRWHAHLRNIVDYAIDLSKGSSSTYAEMSARIREAGALPYDHYHAPIIATFSAMRVETWTNAVYDQLRNALSPGQREKWGKKPYRGIVGKIRFFRVLLCGLSTTKFDSCERTVSLKRIVDVRDSMAHGKNVLTTTHRGLELGASEFDMIASDLKRISLDKEHIDELLVEIYKELSVKYNAVVSIDHPRAPLENAIIAVA